MKLVPSEPNIIIVDSGSSRTRWFHYQNGEINQWETEGLNTYHYSHEDRVKLFWDIDDQFEGSADAIYIYGAGYYDEFNKEMLEEELDMGFGPDTTFEISDDLTGAARALLGNSSGLAVILGTGSNSGFYDGKDIIDRQVSLGFMIGDEGSGSDIGVHLIRDYFYGNMPEHVSSNMEQQFNMDRTDVLRNLHLGRGKRYTAKFAEITSKLSSDEYITDLLTQRFRLFVEQHMMRFSQKDEMIPVALTGSFGVAHKALLNKVLREYGFEIKNTKKEIIEDLAEYHITKHKTEM